jgi:hypothetical protein
MHKETGFIVKVFLMCSSLNLMAYYE